ncbi:MAG: biopolymer transporter ExbD [candidate division Zixibacteria bacterium]|nr:biopolymer transporter ExbD [candidate division Zixibacteria bacterium]
MKTFNFNGPGTSRALAEINVTALIDVMTVLLIIFMIATPIIQSRLQVNLPKARAAAQGMDEGLVVSITRDGGVYLEDRKLSLVEFDAVFDAIYSQADRPPVFIRGDASVPYRAVMEIIDKLKSRGVTRIGLATSLPASK